MGSLQKYNAGLTTFDAFEILFIISEFFSKNEEKNADRGGSAFIEKELVSTFKT